MVLRNEFSLGIRKKHIRIGNKLDCVEGVSLNAAHCQKSITFHNRDVHCLEDTGVFWCLTYPGARQRRGFSPKLPRATRSRPNSGRFCFYSFCFKFLITAAAGRQFGDVRRYQGYRRYRRILCLVRIAVAASPAKTKKM